MTDERRISLVRDRMDLLRKTGPDLRGINLMVSSDKVLDRIEDVIEKTEKEALEWVLRELFEVTP